MSAARRELTIAAAGAALGGGLALIAGGQVWARTVAERPAPLPPVESTISGTEAAPLVSAAGLVLLAAAGALFAVRGVARAAVGLLVAAAGGILLWSGVRTQVVGVAPSDARVVDVDPTAAWPLLAALAGIVAVAVGLLVVLRGRGWTAMGQRYERTGAETRTADRRDRTEEDLAQDAAQEAWQALDRGEDPTDPAPRAEPRPAPPG